MTNYKTCPSCGAHRLLYYVMDGKRVRICFKCFKVQKRVVLALVLIGALVAGPVWAEQIVLDGQEFRAHVARDQAVQADRDNLEQQVGLYRQNERNYRSVVKQLKELQQKTDDKSRAQESLLETYETQRVQLVAQQHELAEEVRRVKQEQSVATWQERGKGFFAGLLAATAVAVYVIRGGR